MLKKAKINIQTPDLIEIVEKYYCSKDTNEITRLADKRSDTQFRNFVKQNPFLLKVNQEIEQIKKFNEGVRKRKQGWQKIGPDGAPLTPERYKEMISVDEINRRTEEEIKIVR